MKNIKLTDKEIATIKKKNKIRNANGQEGFIYFYHDEGKIVALKLFTTTNLQTLDNKAKKIILLHQKPLDDNILKPIKTVSNKDAIIGYTEELVLPNETFEDVKLRNSKKQKIDYLRQAKVLIEHLHSHEIIHGDVNSFNFIISNGIVKICDLDNSSINGLPTDIQHYNLIHYLKKRTTLDYNSDIFCFNLLTIAVLKKIVDIYAINHIQDTFPLYKDIRQIYQEMDDLDSNYNGEYLIDYINEKTKIKFL